MRTIISATALLLAISIGASSEAKTVRASDMTSEMWSQLNVSGMEDFIIEFRQGDQLPVTVAFQGDFVETSQQATSYVTVKRNFWIKPEVANIKISLDGLKYKNIGDVAKGSLELGAGTEEGGTTANGIQMILKSFLK
jgi:hypothetical protein